jgi:hypothetical protein
VLVLETFSGVLNVTVGLVPMAPVTLTAWLALVELSLLVEESLEPLPHADVSRSAVRARTTGSLRRTGMHTSRGIGLEARQQPP